MYCCLIQERIWIILKKGKIIVAGFKFFYGLRNVYNRSIDLLVITACPVIGPHRDDLALSIGGLPARTHASQGEQRSLALALRLAGHRLVAASAGTPPVLLLDDIFSELDPGRSSALLSSLPAGQALLTTAGAVPSDAEPSARVALDGGVFVPNVA